MKPIEQLKIVHAELDRQWESVSARRASMHTRAAILIAAAGLLTSVKASDWGTNWFAIGVALALVAATIGLFVIYPKKGAGADLTGSLRELLTADPYSVEHSIVKDKLEILQSSENQLENLAKWVAIGYLVLIASWLSTFMITVLAKASWI